jgi:hypothetical protein
MKEWMKPKLTLALGLREWEFAVEIGWFPDIDFKLFEFSLLQNYGGDVTIISLQIIKFSFCVVLNQVPDNYD